MKDQIKTKKTIYFKNDFTLRQYSAFSLIFNWIFCKTKDKSTQYKKLTQTHHFQNIYKNKKPYNNFENLLKKLRDYFSHYKHDWPQAELNNSDLSDELCFLVKESIAILENRNKKLAQDEKTEKEIKNELEKMKDNPLRYFSLDSSKNNQPALALISASFLTRSQMGFLIGKFFTGKGIEKESSQYLAMRKVLQTLSQNDRVLLDSSESFIVPKKEIGLAIWTRLEAVGFYNKDGQIEETFPEDQWFMRQLILYLEHTSALPCVSFARLDPESDKEQRQKAFFHLDKKEALKIRNNTIEAEVSLNSSCYKTNFGIQTLKYLVSAHIKKQNINQFVLDYFKKHNIRRGKEYKSYGVTPERLRQRIDFFIKQYESWNSKETKLYHQIRFICDIVNLSWKKQKGCFMNEGEFKNMQEQIRHYRKDSFYKILKENALLNTDNIGLGKNNEIKLGSLIVKNRIQGVFEDILKSHLDWLKSIREKVSQMPDAKQKNIAERLKLTNQSRKQIQDNLIPVAISSKEVRKWLIEKKCLKEETRFIVFIRELCGETPPPFSLFGLKENKRNNKQILLGSRSAKENWTRTALLLQMMKKLLEQDNLNLDEIPSKTEVTEKLDQNIQIRFKLTQGWRNYAKDNEKFLKKLIKVYHKENFKGILALLGENDTTKKKTASTEEKISIESLKNSLHKERYLAMQAIFLWEKGIIEKNHIERKLHDNYLPFNKVLNKSDISSMEKEDIKKIRNACFHNNIWDKKFSNPPEPLKSIYSDLEKQQKKKRQIQKNKAIRKKEFDNIKNKKIS